MKLLVITEVFWPEEGLVNDLVRELKRLGHRVDILTQHPSYPAGRIFPGYSNVAYTRQEWEGSTIHRFRLVEGYRESVLRKIANYRTFVVRGSRIARRIGGDYDRVLVYQTGPLTVALPGVALRRKFGTPLTVWSFDIWPDAVYAYGFPRLFPLTTFLGRIIRRVYRNADHILVSSRSFAEVIAPYVPGREIVYAPNWYVAGPQRPSSVTFERECFNFVFTGNVSRAQNLERVAAGWKRAALQGAALHIVGDGSDMEALERFVATGQIRGIRFWGRRPAEEMADTLAHADALVLPLVADAGVERTEPYKLQSYLHAGKPIFGVIRGAGREIIESNGLGLCADPLDEASIAAGFRAMVAFAREHCQSVAAAAARLQAERFDRRKVIGRVAELLCTEPRMR